MDQLDKALVNAVHAIANKKLQGAVNAAKAAIQNPTPQNKAALERSLQEAQAPVQLAQQVAPNQPVQKNVSRLLELIEQRQLNNNIRKPNFNITKHPNYNNSKKANINAAILRRRVNLNAPPQVPPKPSSNPFNV
jgi:hypothetical protein